MGPESIQISIRSIQKMNNLSNIQKCKQHIPFISFNMFYQGKIKHNPNYPDQNNMDICIQDIEIFYHLSNSNKFNHISYQQDHLNQHMGQSQ
ncbi:hypothetical protein TTHERM_000717689 (macronuclear) [Tetrahymena thermophila SB210]|uniref:Uncharacterized protein n=1 Tax=Tetrahymena thermophila (strain SB210) TaxID=312017 RepID=W7XB79_TETTS|nr:hypothetical protein TTHERM_000717689 [Tetrahymena thermophila SB210]EWS73673.1 hypothetical protein TTHERM_000717689 [Tetrahymena thermophila SB210]|eukprot:XP_012653803.1 hypothetical protein TTHERM_000717689 [Tetrahymena thermophila SB210]